MYIKQTINNKYIIISLVLGIILIAFPQIDLAISKIFFNQQLQAFNLHYNPTLLFIHYGVKVLVTCFVVISFLYGLYCYYKNDKQTLIKTIYLLLVLAIGPGLVVNNLFKDHWGRARPNQIKEFAGSKEFSRAWVINNECSHNCSFVSGHAATGFWLSSFAFVTNNPRRQKIWLIIGIVAGFALGLVRIMMGGHFLSDVYFSGIIVIAIAYWIRKLANKHLS